jgi:hypothetical protein
MCCLQNTRMRCDSTFLFDKQTRVRTNDLFGRRGTAQDGNRGCLTSRRCPLAPARQTHRGKVFLSTDAGGVGLNLQVASAVINFEPPWNPARATDRSGQQTSVIQQKFRRVGHDLCIAHVLLSCHESMIQTKARWRSPGSRAYFFSACAGFQTTQDRQSTRDWRGCRVAFLLLGMKSAS